MNPEGIFLVTQGWNLSVFWNSNTPITAEEYSCPWHVAGNLACCCSTVPGREALCSDEILQQGLNNFKQEFLNCDKSLLDWHRPEMRCCFWWHCHPFCWCWQLERLLVGAPVTVIIKKKKSINQANKPTMKQNVWESLFYRDRLIRG